MKVSAESCRNTGFRQRGINITFSWDCTVEGNYLDGVYGTNQAEHGIQIWGNWNETISAGNFVIANNIVKNVTGGGIWGSYFEYSTITGNHVEECGDVGIDLEGCLYVNVINDNHIESLRDNSTASSGGGVYLYWADSIHPCQRNTVTNNVIRGFTTLINDNCWGNNASYNCIKNNRVNTIYRRAGIYYNGLIDSNISIDNPKTAISDTQY